MQVVDWPQAQQAYPLPPGTEPFGPLQACITASKLLGHERYTLCRAQRGRISQKLAAEPELRTAGRSWSTPLLTGRLLSPPVWDLEGADPTPPPCLRDDPLSPMD